MPRCCVLNMPLLLVQSCTMMARLAFIFAAASLHHVTAVVLGSTRCASFASEPAGHAAYQRSICQHPTTDCVSMQASPQSSCTTHAYLRARWTTFSMGGGGCVVGGLKNFCVSKWCVLSSVFTCKAATQAMQRTPRKQPRAQKFGP